MTTIQVLSGLTALLRSSRLTVTTGHRQMCVLLGVSQRALSAFPATLAERLLLLLFFFVLQCRAHLTCPFSTSLGLFTVLP
jgi:hypothetical protein